MRRCEKPATHFSIFNGMKLCKEHAEGKVTNVIDEGTPKPCDMPIETTSEFWNRMKEERRIR